MPQPKEPGPMLTWEEDVEAAALRAQGWSISAIARHLGRDPKTIRAYLAGERTPGQRRSSAPDGFAPFVDYLTARLREDRHVWATALYDEIRSLGYQGSYPSFTRALRARALRPRCEACAGVKGRERVEIAHPPGEETQLDWVELPGAPWGGSAHVLVGALAYSSQTRAVLAETEDLAHLAEALDGVVRRFGGLTRRWRVDRMATAVDPSSGRLQPGFAAVAKHYRVGVDPCPPRRANRKGVVEKAIHFLTQRWWRTARLEGATQVQASLDRFCATTGDGRPRPGGRTVGELAETESLRPLPIDPFPATIEVTRKVTATCLVAFRGNHYSVPPGLVGQTVVVRHRLGSLELEIRSGAGLVLAQHRLAPAGAGRILRLAGHAAALQQVVLAAFTTDPPCPHKPNRPPGPEALHAARQLTLLGGGASEVTVDLAHYAELAAGEDR
jgi:transposase